MVNTGIRICVSPRMTRHNDGQVILKNFFLYRFKIIRIYEKIFSYLYNTIRIKYIQNLHYEMQTLIRTQ